MSSSLWPRDDRQSLPTIARRATAAGPLRERLDDYGIRSRAFLTVGGARLLLQHHAVPLSVRLVERNARQTRSRAVCPARSGASRRLHSADQARIQRADRALCRDRLRAVVLRLSGWRRRVAMDSAAV